MTWIVHVTNERTPATRIDVIRQTHALRVAAALKELGYHAEAMSSAPIVRSDYEKQWAAQLLTAALHHMADPVIPGTCRKVLGNTGDYKPAARRSRRR